MLTNIPGEVGNGRATAILLARQGAKVALLDHNEAWARDTKRMIDDEGGESEVIQTDVIDENSCRNAVAQAVKVFGSISILVNIVGVGGAMGDATAVDLGAWERDLRINVTSMVLMSRHVIPEMRRHGRGAIVNMSSVSGLLGGKFVRIVIRDLPRTVSAETSVETIR